MRNWKTMLLLVLLVTTLMFPSGFLNITEQVRAAPIVYVWGSAPVGWYDASHVKTIAEGIANVSVGGTVYIWDGTYEEHDLVIGKSLTLQGNSSSVLVDGSTGATDYIFSITAGNVSIFNLNITGSPVFTPLVEIRANDVNISGCYFSNETGEPESGICMVDAQRIIIYDNDFKGEFMAIFTYSQFSDVDHLAIRNNRFEEGGGWNPALVQSDTVTNISVQNNTFVNSFLALEILVDSSGVLICDNVFYSSKCDYGIYLSGSVADGFVICNNEFYDIFFIALEIISLTMDNTLIYDNIFSSINTTTGTKVNVISFETDSASGSEFYGNQIYAANISGVTWDEANSVAIRIARADGLRIHNNSMTGYYTGFYFTNLWARFIEISDNIIYNFTKGIYMPFGSENTIHSNFIWEGEYGFYGGSDCNNLTVYNNCFDNAVLNAHDEGVDNRWNITKTPGWNILGGSYLGGNWWSDYTGDDVDADGLGDTGTPHNSSGGIVTGGDYLPLVGEPEFPSPPIPPGEEPPPPPFRPDAPTNLTVRNTDVGEQTLWWTHGAGYNQSMVRGSTIGYPATPSSGELIYFGVDNTTVHTGLAGSNATWYYRVWEYAEPEYSLSYAEASLKLPEQPWTGDDEIQLIGTYYTGSGFDFATVYQNGSQCWVASSYAGLKVYEVDDGVFTLIDVINDDAFRGPFAVCGDGRYIYAIYVKTEVEYPFSPTLLRAFSFDGTNIVPVASEEITGDELAGRFMDYGGGTIHLTITDAGLFAFTFDGAAFTEVARVLNDTNCAVGDVTVDPENSFLVYVGTSETLAGGYYSVSVYQFGSEGYSELVNHTPENATSPIGIFKVKGTRYVLVAFWEYGMKLYEFTGTSLIHRAWRRELTASYYDVVGELDDEGLLHIFAALDTQGVIWNTWDETEGWDTIDHRDDGSWYRWITLSTDGKYLYCPCATAGIRSYAPMSPPYVQTASAMEIGYTSAILRGAMIDGFFVHASNVWFQWGETLYDNDSSSQTKQAGEDFSLLVTGLEPNTTYHFRATVNNSWYQTVNYGDDMTFFSAPGAPPVFGPPNPANGSKGRPTTLIWSIPILDADSTFDWTIECSNGQSSGGFGETDGTKSVYLLRLALFRTYTVWVNATDGVYTTRAWFRFTTGTTQTIPPSEIPDVVRIPPVQPPKYPVAPFTVPEMYVVMRANVRNDAQVVIVVIDSGTTARTYDDVDLAPIVSRYHPVYLDGDDEFGHGTWVNYAVRYGIQQYSPNSVQYSIKTFDARGDCQATTFLEALDMAKALNPDIVTISAGVIGTATDVFSQKVNELRSEGIFVTVSAGNNGPYASTVTSPAASAGAVAVGATDPIQINGMKTLLDLSDDIICDFSSRGPVIGVYPKPNFVCPGESIIGPWGEGTKIASGTSMAAPFLAAGALQVIGANKLVLDIVRFIYGNKVYLNIIETSFVDSAYEKGDRNAYGWGIPNVEEAVSLAWMKAVYAIVVFCIIVCALVIMALLVYRLSRKKR